MTNENESIEKKLRRFSEVEPPADLLEKIHSAIPAELGSSRGPVHRTNRWLPIAAALSIAFLAGIVVWRSDLRTSRVISASEIPTAASSSDSGNEPAMEAARANGPEVDVAAKATTDTAPAPPPSAPARMKKDQADGETSLTDAVTAEVRTEAVNAAPATEREAALSVTANSPQVAQVAAPPPAAPPPAPVVARRSSTDASATTGAAGAMLEVQQSADDSSRDRKQNQALAESTSSADSIHSFRTLTSISRSLRAGVLPQGSEVDAHAIAQSLLASRSRSSELKIVATRSPFGGAGIIALVTGSEKTAPSSSKLERSPAAAKPQNEIAGETGKRSSPELTRVVERRNAGFYDLKRGSSLYRIKASDVESWKNADPELRLAVTALYLGELLAAGSTDPAEWNRLLDQAEKLPKAVRDEELIAVVRRAKQLTGR